MDDYHPVIIDNSSNALHCPRCGGDNLHHDLVVVYHRQEDEAHLTRTAASGSIAQVALVPHAGSGNPSARRDGLAVRFWCEGCELRSELTFAQHKGETHVAWRSPAHHDRNLSLRVGPGPLD